MFYFILLFKRATRYPFLNDAMQLPSAIQGNNTPTLQHRHCYMLLVYAPYQEDMGVHHERIKYMHVGGTHTKVIQTLVFRSLCPKPLQNARTYIKKEWRRQTKQGTPPTLRYCQVIRCLWLDSRHFFAHIHRTMRILCQIRASCWDCKQRNYIIHIISHDLNLFSNFLTWLSSRFTQWRGLKEAASWRRMKPTHLTRKR